MASSWPKFIRDPVHGLIRFDNTALDHLLLRLIGCKEFQRLRRIKQLGFCDMVFPGATHTRFAHSIGVMQNAKKFMDRLERIEPTAVSEPHRTTVIVGCLLHDVGHGPFSHAFEQVTGENHEKRTVDIVRDQSTEVNKALSEFRDVPDLVSHVAALFPEGVQNEPIQDATKFECPQHLLQVLSSQLDADRSDYLVRDSHAVGTEYGRFDFDWLLDHMCVDLGHKRLFLDSKARHGVEDYVFARYHMYQSVYFHKTTRAAEVMFRLLLDRYKSKLSECVEKDRSRVVVGASPEIIRAFSQTATLQDYLLLDDHSITSLLHAAAKSDDRTLVYLSKGLLNRQLYKCMDASECSSDRVGEFKSSVTTMVDRTLLPVDGTEILVKDTPSDTPYKIYDPDDDDPAFQIYVEMPTGITRELSTQSDIVAALKKRVTLLRYYFPMELREQIQGIADRHLKEVSQ